MTKLLSSNVASIVMNETHLNNTQNSTHTHTVDKCEINMTQNSILKRRIENI